MTTSTFSFDRKTTALLDKLRQRTRSSNRAQTIRKALYLLNIVVDANKENKKVVFVSKNKEQEILI